MEDKLPFRKATIHTIVQLRDYIVKIITILLFVVTIQKKVLDFMLQYLFINTLVNKK